MRTTELPSTRQHPQYVYRWCKLSLPPNRVSKAITSKSMYVLAPCLVNEKWAANTKNKVVQMIIEAPTWLYGRPKKLQEMCGVKCIIS